MILKLHTTRSLFQKLLIQTISNCQFSIMPLLLGAAFIFSLEASATLKIAVVDTGFCSDKAKINSKTHKVLKALDMTETNGMDCSKVTDQVLNSSGRFHGQQVLNEFLSYLPKKLNVSIQPLVVYDRTGMQTETGWKNAIAYVEKQKIDIVLTASGLIYPDKIVTELPSIWFVPSGRIERLIDTKTVLFPQSLAPKPNLFIIGDYFDKGQIIYDQSLVYQDQIDYYFPSGNKKFTGTSRAVAHAMAKALDQCFIEKDVIAAHSLRLCLMKKEKILKDRILKKEFKTF